MTRPSARDLHDVDPCVASVVGNAMRRLESGSPASTAFLLLDFLGNASSAQARGDDAVAALLRDPQLQSVGLAAAAAHRADLDDVHWPTLTHPGSIVWPGVLAHGVGRCSGRQVAGAATVGYEVTIEVARLIASAGVHRWHRTALAGTAGAAAAVANARGFDEQQSAQAVALALTVAGGVGQTMVERSGASGFHRACAAQDGVAAVGFSASGMTAPEGVLSGPCGLIAACGGSLPAAPPSRLNEPPAIESTTIRVYPTNGFAQAAVAATVRARESFDRPATEISVGVNPAVVAQFRAPPANRHWDLLGAVRSAWSSGDPWTVDEGDLATPTAVLEEADGLAIGGAQVTVRAGSEQLTVRVDSDFCHPRVDVALAFEKWSRQGVMRPDERYTVLREWLASDELADPRIFRVASAGPAGRASRR